MQYELWQWILRADRIEDPKARSGDMEYFLSDDEADGDDRLECLLWHEIEVPIAHFGCKFEQSELGYATDRQLADEPPREARILEWVRKEGGWQNALKRNPVIAIFTGERLLFVDGWHRCKMAQRDGQTLVRACIGVHRETMAALEVSP